jgi:hypothetical protein
MKIVSFDAGDEDRIREVCRLLVQSFRPLSPTWVPTPERTREVVEAVLPPDRAVAIPQVNPGECKVQAPPFAVAGVGTT